MQDSIWFQTVSGKQRQALRECDPLPKSCEVAIVGAGMIGIATAYYLTEEGLTDICVLDRGAALGEASGANAGGLWFAQQSAELGPVAPLAAASSRLYDELAQRFSFDFERCGMLELLSEEQSAESGAKIEATRKAGFQVEKLDGRSVRALEPALGAEPAAALYYPDEGHLHPVKLGCALVQHLKSRGVRFCLDTEVRRLEPSLDTTRGLLQAETVLVATGAWTPQVTRTLGWAPPIKPLRGTLLVVGPLPKTLYHTVMAEHFYYWQLADGYVGGGGSVDDVGFAQGVDPQTEERIRREMNSLIPAVAKQPTVCSWSGFRPYCEDLRPVIGKAPGRERIFVAAGHFKKGIMLAPITGKILAEWITKGCTPFDVAALSPNRFRAGDASPRE